ncbi:hypothetical protein KUTeg_001987 [Tegillarca granosa]|uniref:Uncharacterized protein n=1 Tax=Tegillarca granosa TaxID=220873 RepID=A0ABQ9FXD3_TEGGR|nr:hypothetical protein KUTeg_001987 [Tegillarca granosa]
MNAENRLSHDRSMNDRPRTSPRNSDNSQVSSHHSYQGQSRRGDNSMNHSHAHSSIQQSVDNGISNRQSDSLPPSQRRSYRSRRRRDDDGARIPRQSIPSSQTTTKDNKSLKETQFDLEINSFPPLPGPGTSSSSSSTAGDIFDSKMSDVVKGTAKPQVREVKPQRVPSPVQVPSPPTPPPASTITSSSTMVTSTPLPQQAQKEDGGDSSCNSSNGSSLNGVSAVPSVVSSSNNSANVTTAPTDTRVPTPPVSPPKSNKSFVNSTESQQKLISEPAATRVVAVPTQTHVKVVDKQVMSVPVKLSYAQMVQRGRENEATAEFNQSEDSMNKADSSNQSSSSSNRANQTLKEQSQTIKPSSTANSKLPGKEQGSRKDNEAKDQRLNNSRRSKENRERRDRRRERSDRDGSRSSNK